MIHRHTYKQNTYSHKTSKPKNTKLKIKTNNKNKQTNKNQGQGRVGEGSRLESVEKDTTQCPGRSYGME